MLLKFRVANYRSIREEQELSFIATELNEGTARDVEVKPAGSVRVLPAIGLYGANASGKSNVLNALIHLGRLVRGQLRSEYESDRKTLGWEPHTLDSATREQPTHYEVEFLSEGVRYGYGLRFNDDVVQGEWLHAYPQGRRQVWFERDPASPDRLRFPDNHLGSTQSTLAELARPDRPFISLASEVRQANLAPIASWFGRLSSLTAPVRSSPLVSEGLVPLFTGERAGQVIDMLQRADPGIEGAEVVDVEPSEREVALGLTRRRREVRLRHRGRTGASLLALRLESDGTRAWLRILRPLLRALESGGVLVVDELDGSLHPELAAEAIRMFYDSRLNRHGAQLLFSSHDVSMLSPVFGRPLLDRDQLWFTEKNDEGATELYPLADLKPRKGENLERGYLSGRYGAVPGLSPGELARALWPETDGAEKDGPAKDGAQ
jgi:AAA domain, putative AbiEii toxin, Type IV TA system